MNVQVGGILGFVLLVCVVYAIVKITQSSASAGNKVIWIVVLLMLPFLGFILWYFFGPK